jgi:CMP-2-keto-3-deoxyoctulosonic acid synthetase
MPSLETSKFSLYFSGSCIPTNPKAKLSYCGHYTYTGRSVQDHLNVTKVCLETTLRKLKELGGGRELEKIPEYKQKIVGKMLHTARGRLFKAGLA